MVFSYDGISRDLKRIIISLLKSGNATNIKKFNYVHDFSLDGTGRVKKAETRLVMIESNDEKKLLLFLKKSFPELKKLTINLSESNLGEDNK